MTPNEWWKEEPYFANRPIFDSFGVIVDWEESFDIPAIIEEVKRREREREYHICCRQCGLSTSFSPNDK